MEQWISVKDRLPSEEEEVLILIRETSRYGNHREKINVNREVFCGSCFDGEWLTTYCFGFKYISEAERENKSHIEVTHWMPLPGLPKDDVKTIEELSAQIEDIEGKLKYMTDRECSLIGRDAVGNILNALNELLEYKQLGTTEEIKRCIFERYQLGDDENDVT